MMRNTLTFLIAFALILGATPRTANAQWVVEDPMNLIENAISAGSEFWQQLKDGGLDAIAWEVANVAIQSLTRSTVNWINSGFEGEPAFVTDLNRNLLRVGDTVADDFFDQLNSRNEIDSPFRDDIVRAVRDNYYRSTGTGTYFNQNRFTLNEFSENPQAFLSGDFSQGGFGAWLETWRNPQNNPFGAFHQAQSEVGGRVTGAQSVRQTELNWGSGFQSYRGNCGSRNNDNNGSDVSLSDTDECLGSSVRTNGSTIKAATDKVLGAQQDRLVQADEFNEILGELLAQLVSNMLSEGGMTGLSQASSGGGRSYVDRATTGDGNGGTISNTFTQTINSQRTQITTYKTNWEKIQGAAQRAAANCSANNPEIVAVLNEAAAAIAKANASLTAIDGLIADIQAANQAAGSNQVNALQAISEKYQKAMAETFPTPAEMARAKSESRSTGEGGDSLYMQMDKKAKSCGSS